jgi:murein DD-endopeptidase / murein LD-carboxypeptidase
MSFFIRLILYRVFPLLLVFFWSSCSSHKNTSRDTAHKEEPSAEAPKKISSKYAEILGVPKNNIDNVPLYMFIESWYGTPYKYGGSNKKGIDCSNFTSALYNEVYHKPLKGTSSSIFEQCKTVSKEKLKEGDLVFFKIEKDKISHIGVYLQNNKFVHATTKKGVMIDDLDEAYYKKYFYKGGRIQG